MDGVKVKQGDKRPEYRIIAQGMITGAFGAVAVATKHEHWLKSPEEVEPIVGPLCRMIEQLPPKTLKAFEKNVNAIALASGTLVLVGTDLTEEIRLRREAKENETWAKEKAGSGRNPLRIFSNGTTEDRNGRVPPINEQQPTGGVAGWVDANVDDDATVDFRY